MCEWWWTFPDPFFCLYLSNEEIEWLKKRRGRRVYQRYALELQGVAFDGGGAVATGLV